MSNKTNSKRGGSKTTPKTSGRKPRNISIPKRNGKDVGEGQIVSNAKLSNKGRDNDPNWYFNNATIAEQASELSFQAFLGDGPIWKNYTIPTISVALLAPSPGNSYGKVTTGDITDSEKVLNSGLNLMASKIYTMLSTYTGRTSSYAPQDIGLMLCATASLAEFSEHLRRCFGVMLTYNERNRAVPLGLIRAMGVRDPMELVRNLAAFRMRFNVAMNRINQIPLLDNIGFIRKSRDLFQHVYLDGISSMAQIFMYVPRGVWYFNETGDNQGSILEWVPSYAANGATSGMRTFDQLLTMLETMVDRLLTSSTLNIVYADLLNLASKINVPFWKFDYLAENYVVIPEYNRNAILQFHNMDIIGDPVDVESDNTHKWTHDGVTYTGDNYVFCDVDNNAVVYNPVFSAADATFYDVMDSSVVDMDTDVPTLEDRIEALRFKVLMPGMTVTTGSGIKGFAFAAIPDHYCTCLLMYQNPLVGNPDFQYYNQVNESDLDLTYLARLSQLSGHPLFYVDRDAVVGDLNFCTQIDFPYLARLNKVIYSGLFDFRVS